MCYSAKASLIAWWILALMFLFLWYRNEKYDRVIAAFVLTLGLIQLLEYGIHSGVNPDQSGRAIFITLWLQCLVLAIGTYIYLKNIWSLSLLIVFAIVFVGSLIYALLGRNKFTASVGESNHIEWYLNGGPILGNWGWLYILGIFLPLLLILAGLGWTDAGILILIFYGIISAVYIAMYFPAAAFASMWCYVTVGFAFLAWMIGIFSTMKPNSFD